METTYEEFQSHYRHASKLIDFMSAFEDGRRVLEKTSKDSILDLIRVLNLLKSSFNNFEYLIKHVLHYPDEEDPEDP